MGGSGVRPPQGHVLTLGNLQFSKKVATSSSTITSVHGKLDQMIITYSAETDSRRVIMSSFSMRTAGY